MQKLIRRVVIVDILKDISSILGVIISAITLITLLSNKFREKLISFFKKRNDEIDEINNTQDGKIHSIEQRLASIEESNEIVKEFMLQQCKTQIKSTFYKYRNKEIIPYYEWQCTDAAYKIYHNSLKGNHDTSCLYEQMCKWQVDCTEKLGE